MLASGTSFPIVSAIRFIFLTRLCTKYTCPSRFNSWSIAFLITSESKRNKSVCIDCLSWGAVFRDEISLIPRRDRCNVRGIGVAVNVRTSTDSLNFFSFSLCATPNLCSSSMTINPTSLKVTSFWTNLCVPITISTFPSFKSSNISFCSFRVLNLLNTSILTG